MFMSCTQSAQPSWVYKKPTLQFSSQTVHDISLQVFHNQPTQEAERVRLQLTFLSMCACMQTELYSESEVYRKPV